MKAVTIEEAITQARQTIGKLQQFLDLVTIFTGETATKKKKHRRTNGSSYVRLEKAKAILATTGPLTVAELAARMGEDKYLLNVSLCSAANSQNPSIIRTARATYGLRPTQ